MSSQKNRQFSSRYLIRGVLVLKNESATPCLLALRSVLSCLLKFSGQQYFEKVALPKTTSALEGSFAHLKRCLNNHNGLSETNKDKIVLGFLEAWGSKESDT